MTPTNFLAPIKARTKANTEQASQNISLADFLQSQADLSRLIEVVEAQAEVINTQWRFIHEVNNPEIPAWQKTDNDYWVKKAYVKLTTLLGG